MTVDSEEVLAVLVQHSDSGLKAAEILDALGASRKEQGRLRRQLATMMEEGLVERVVRGTYAPTKRGRRRVRAQNKGGRRRAQQSSPDQWIETVDQSPLVKGRIRVHPAGYGFVVRDDGLADVFVPAKYRGSALDGDEVTLFTWEGFKGSEGRVEEILARGRAKLTGVLEKVGSHLYVSPDDPRIVTDFGRVTVEGGPCGAHPGECVVLEITHYPTRVEAYLSGRVVKVLGPPDDPRTEIQKILICADIPVEMPEVALQQARETPDSVGLEDHVDRIDLRDRDFVTIDPETARDFDDAICIEEGPRGGPRVWVAVADVSHYVQPGDALDQEAQIRGVSVYLPDQVVPMLPMELSAGICSLNPHVERCAMVVRLDFDAENKLVDTGFAAAVIESKDRLDYPGVAAALGGDFRGPRERYRKWSGVLEELNELAQALRKRRRGRGTLELDIPEPKVILDADDPLLVRDVVRSKGIEGVRGAYELVEEFMIAANEAVGAFFESRGLDTVWRIHAPPKEERVAELAEILAAFDIEVDVADAMSPQGMRQVLEAVSTKPAAQALSFLVLRSLTQATYDVTNVGHFGLASTEYLHFTSPIRRYPDVLVHRLLKIQLHKEGQASGRAGRWGAPNRGELQELAVSSSGHERRAIEAEREAVAMYRAYLMREYVGEHFSGRITGVTHFGAFVEMESPFVEGLIKVDSLGEDFFDFDPVLLTLNGRKTGWTVALGDLVEVEVLNVSVALRRIELRLVRGGFDVTARGTRREKKKNVVKRGALPAMRGKESSRGKHKAKTAEAKAKQGAHAKSRGKAKKATAKVNHIRRKSTKTRKKR